MAIGICADDKFAHLGEGVYHNDDCCKDKLGNHAPLLVGYGNDPKGGDYWLVKNSWCKLKTS